MPSEIPPSDLVVEINDARNRLPAPDRRRLVEIARRVLEAEGIGSAEISIAIVDDEFIHEINRRHLDHDRPTDVISFVLSDPDDDRLSGELVVSAQTAARMADRDDVEPWTELVLYVVHGLLHLCGHDDATEADAASMRRREAECLAELGLAHPFTSSEPEVGSNARSREHSSWRI